jgi:hypothetical protein
MKLSNLVLILGSTIFLSGCFTTTGPIQTSPAVIPAVIAPVPAPVNMRPVRWQVLTTADLQRIVAEQEANPDPNFVLYALDNGNFQALNLNLVDIRQFVLEQQEVITFYEKVEADAHAEAEEEPARRRCFLGLCL